MSTAPRTSVAIRRLRRPARALPGHEPCDLTRMRSPRSDFCRWRPRRMAEEEANACPHGAARRGTARTARHGAALPARRGTARHCPHGAARRGTARHGRHGGTARHGAARSAYAEHVSTTHPIPSPVPATASGRASSGASRCSARSCSWAPPAPRRSRRAPAWTGCSSTRSTAPARTPICCRSSR